MNVLSRTIAILIIMATLGNCAHATLISDLSERDYLTAGDNGLTYDATTGLEWLDFRYTLGNSIDQTDIELESEFSDFRWATSDEVSALLLTLINGTSTENSLPYRGFRWISYFSGVCVTNESPCPPAAYGNPLTKFLHFFSDDYNDIDDRDVATRLLREDYSSVNLFTGINKMPIAGGKISLLEYEASESFRYLDPTFLINKRVVNPVAHSWLVRQAATSVPEPSTLVIFTLGLIGLASRRFSKKP